MRVIVDLTRCQGYAQCAFLAPSAFKMKDGDALVYDSNPDDALREQILRAAAACPVQAIHVREMGALEALRKDTAQPRKPAARVRDTHTTAAFKRDGRIVIVGASLAGLRAAEALRDEGFTGSLTLIGDEPDAPYDRPPLSKQVLHGLGAGRPHRAAPRRHARRGLAAWASAPSGSTWQASRSGSPTDRRSSSTGC